MASEQRLHLSRMHITNFGAFANRVVGPFEPGLNIVYGSNEAGKSTLNAFLGGVLFGWEEARGSKNTYKPANASRAGSLVFANEHTGEELELKRVKNTDGLQVVHSSITSMFGEEVAALGIGIGGAGAGMGAGVGGVATSTPAHASLGASLNAVDPQAAAALAVGDIDKATFASMFALTSDELRGLKNTDDVMAKLLTAGSGTSESPAHVFAALQEDIASYTSRAASAEHSITQLEAKAEELRARIAAQEDEVNRLKGEDKELRDLEPRQRELSAALTRVNNTIETLTEAKSALSHHDASTREAQEALLAAERRLEEARAQHAAYAHNNQAHAAEPNPAKHEVILERIEELSDEAARSKQALELAADAHLASKAAYEAACEEARDAQQDTGKGSAARAASTTAVLAVLFAAMGLFALVYGCATRLYPVAVAGFLLIGVGIAQIVMASRNGRTKSTEVESLELRCMAAKRAMLQDAKRLEECRAQQERQRMQAVQFLHDVGLDEAQGSLRQARILLEAAAAYRKQFAALEAQLAAATTAHELAQTRAAELTEQRASLCARFGLPNTTTVGDVSRRIEALAASRTTHLEELEADNRRIGQLKQELARARSARDFDAVKLENQLVRTRIADSERDLVRLLLARRILAQAIASWETDSQPQVYRLASSLFERMTAGAWVQIRTDAKGKLQVIDKVHRVLDPLRLSLGTCQQLYLSLRMALLITAANVGRAIPVMADDILVNFDDERRRGAAEALKILSEYRQVIVFTCHEDVVKLMQEVDPTSNCIAL